MVGRELRWPAARQTELKTRPGGRKSLAVGNGVHSVMGMRIFAALLCSLVLALSLRAQPSGAPKAAPKKAEPAKAAVPVPIEGVVVARGATRLPGGADCQ